jgi:membrane protease YdiL (CAAX protease family)
VSMPETAPPEVLSEPEAETLGLNPRHAGNTLVLGQLLGYFLSVMLGLLTAGRPVSVSKDSLSTVVNGQYTIFGILLFIAVTLLAASPLLVAGIYARKSHLSLREAFRVRRMPAKDLLFPLCLAPILTAFSVLVWVLISVLTRGRALEAVQSIPGQSEIGDSFILSLISVVMAASLTEEMLFRGFMSRTFEEWGVGWSVFAPSLLFALVHHPMSIPGALACGVLGASLTIRHNSVLPSVVMHAAANTIPLLSAFIIRSWTQRFDPALKSIPVLLMFLFLLVSALTVIILRFRSEFKELMRHIGYAWMDFTKRPEFGPRALILLKHWSYIVIILLFILGCAYPVLSEFVDTRIPG